MNDQLILGLADMLEEKSKPLAVKVKGNLKDGKIPDTIESGRYIAYLELAETLRILVQTSNIISAESRIGKSNTN